MNTQSLEGSSHSHGKNLALMILNKKNWFIQFMLVAGISIAGLLYLGTATYSSAPPIVNFVSPTGQVVFSRDDINRGNNLFLMRGLMNWGSFWGDGAERGPDFSADALYWTVDSMRNYYMDDVRQRTGTVTQADQDMIDARIKRELRTNTWNGVEDTGFVVLNEAQVKAYNDLVEHYWRYFNDPAYDKGRFQIVGYITNRDDIRALASFFFWGGWVAVTNRPGHEYSYTHNWPYHPEVGNVATTQTLLWSILSIFALFIGIGAVLYVYGQMKQQPVDVFEASNGVNGWALTTYDLENGFVRPTQRATYKFFALAMILFLIQVTMGVVSATDFIRPMGINLGELIPFTTSRSFHILLQIYWFFLCWVGYTIFFLPRLSRIPAGQKALINILFAACVVVGVGTIVGIYLGQGGHIQNETMSYWFGSQGWEFMEMGRFFQILLLAAFVLWIYIIYRGVKPWLTRKNIWSVPSWLLYGSGIMVAFLFFGLFITQDQNFATADYWRWMVVHMWVEVTFEVFTTVIVGYLLVQMGLVTRLMAERVIFLAVMLFLITATIGISHNFYWIAKPTGIIALGSVFSTLQVLPLLLLTLDAWQMRQEVGKAHQYRIQGKQVHVMEAVWLYILAVNFWNIFGAGVFGSLINLPIVNYYEHATYLTGHHAHGAMMGVKGMVALGGMLFCCQHLFHKYDWDEKLLKVSFWSLNIGLLMMMFLAMFWMGLYQTYTGMTEGFWYARSHHVTEGVVFKTLTHFRALGGAVFILGGVLPLVWFVLSRGFRLQPEVEVEEGEWKAYENERDWASQESSLNKA